MYSRPVHLVKNIDVPPSMYEIAISRITDITRMERFKYLLINLSVILFIVAAFYMILV
jgi:hypothetical protein